MVRADLPDEQRRQRLRDGGEADAPVRRGFEPAEQSADGSFSRGGARLSTRSGRAICGAASSFGLCCPTS